MPPSHMLRSRTLLPVWLSIACSVALLVAACTATSVLASPAAAAAAASVSWLRVTPTIEGGRPLNHTSSSPSAPPSPRCEHAFVRVNRDLAMHMRPDYPWREGVSLGPEGAQWSSSIAFTIGGRGADGQVLSDAWLLQVDSSAHSSRADWVKAPPTPLRPRRRYSLQFLPKRGELIAFGGVDALGIPRNDTYVYELGAGAWQPLGVAAASGSVRPIPRQTGSAWVRFTEGKLGEDHGQERLLLFGGSSSAAPASALGDMWTLLPPSNAIPSDPTEAQQGWRWAQPEGNAAINALCAAKGSACPTDLTFAQRFPGEVARTVEGLLAAAAASTDSLRPNATARALRSLSSLSASLSAAFQSPPLANYSTSHSLVNGPCMSFCAQFNSTLTAARSRPAARQDAGLSLWDWTDPRTEARVRKMVLWGGSRCVGDQGGTECFDANLYLLDLDTWKWTVHVAPLATNRSSTPWPSPRAAHAQWIVTSESRAQLWIRGGFNYDWRGRAVFLDDVAVFDLLEETWALSGSVPGHGLGGSEAGGEGRIDTFVAGPDADGSTPRPPASAFQASFLGLLGEDAWLHGGCVASASGPGSLSPLPLSGPPDASLWVAKLNQPLSAANVRVVNAAPDDPFGQGLSQAQPGPLYDAQGRLYRYNTFHLHFSQSMGGSLLPASAMHRSIVAFNEALVGTPRTNSTPMPWWGPDLPYATGMAAGIDVLLVSNLVPKQGAGTAGVAAAGPLIALHANPGFPREMAARPGVYEVQYSITEGSSFHVYVSFAGQDVPGSPFLLSLQSGPASAENSEPLPASRGIPSRKVDAWGQVTTQHEGNMEIPMPLAGEGLGLSKALRGWSANFLLQIVDIYLNPWTGVGTATAKEVAAQGGLQGEEGEGDGDGDGDAQAQQVRISLALVDPSTGVVESNFSLSHFNYVNNLDGTYTVTYISPNRASFGLAVYVDGQRTSGGRWFVVDGVEELKLDRDQMIIMLFFGSLVGAITLASMLLFVCNYASPYQRSRSMLFDAMWTLGTVLGTLALLEQTPFSGGVSVGPDHRVSAGSHNACQLHNVLLGASVILCFGALYGMVIRARAIQTSIRASVSALSALHVRRDIAITLNQEQGSMHSTSHGQLPRIPNVPSDWLIARPIFICLAVELLFEMIWVFAAPLAPSIHVANDGFRTYAVCDGSDKPVWVWVSIGIKGAMGAWLLYYASGGRRVADPLGEARRVAWTAQNMALTSVVATALVFPMDSSDSIKTSFVVSTFAIVWSTLMGACLLFIPRVRVMLRAKASPYWYDEFILAVQQAEKEARQRAEKDDNKNRDALNGPASSPTLGSQSTGVASGSLTGARAAAHLREKPSVSTSRPRTHVPPAHARKPTPLISPSLVSRNQSALTQSVPPTPSTMQHMDSPLHMMQAPPAGSPSPRLPEPSGGAGSAEERWRGVSHSGFGGDKLIHTYD